MRAILISSLLVLLNSCCDCSGPYVEDAIHFQFDSSFAPSEIDAIEIVRLTENSMIKLDSVEIATSEDAMFEFTRTQPFSSIEKYWQYDYLIKVKTGTVFHLTEINIAGENGSGLFCQCYQNTKKKLKLDGQALNFTGKGSAWYDNLVVLSK